jgi:hypothetical protein
MSDWKKRLGVLYSTDPNYSYTTEENALEEATLPPAEQRLRLSLSRKQRGGKEVTLVSGFVGSSEDLEVLGRTLRQRCGVGGSVKDGEILIQGDQRPKLIPILQALGYTKTRG